MESPKRIRVCLRPVRGMSLRKVTSLGSNIASVADLIRIETPQSLGCDFGPFFRGYKNLLTLQPIEFEFKFEPLPVIWQSLRRLFEKNQKIITGLERQNQRPSSWGRSPALLFLCGSDGRAQIQGVSESAPTRWQSLRAATAGGSLEENMLPLLRY